MVALIHDRHRITHAIIVGTKRSLRWDTKRQLESAGIHVADMIDPLQFGAEGISGAIGTAVLGSGALATDVLLVAIDGGITPVIESLEPTGPQALLWLVTDIGDEVPSFPPPYVRTWVVVAEEAAEHWRRLHSTRVSAWNSVDTMWAYRAAVTTAAGHVAQMLRTWQLARHTSPIVGSADVTLGAVDVHRNRLRFAAEVQWHAPETSKLNWSASVRFQGATGVSVDVPLVLDIETGEEGAYRASIRPERELGIDIAQAPPGTYYLRIDIASEVGRFISGPLSVRLHCHSVFRRPLPTQPPWDISVAMVGAGSLNIGEWDEAPDAGRHASVCRSLRYVHSPIVHSLADLQRWSHQIVHTAHAEAASVVLIDALHVVDHRSTLRCENPLAAAIEFMREQGFAGTIVVPRLRVESKNSRPHSEFVDLVKSLQVRVDHAEAGIQHLSDVIVTEPVSVVVDEASRNRHNVLWSDHVNYARLQQAVWRALEFHCELSISRQSAIL